MSEFAFPPRRTSGHGARWRVWARSFGMTPAMLRDRERVNERLARLDEQIRRDESKRRFLEAMATEQVSE